MNTNRLEEIRADALRHADRAQRDVRLLFALAAIVEFAALGGFILLMNFRDPLHRLLLVHALLIYGTLGVGLVTLGAYVRASALRILQAIDLASGRSSED